jgi:hypothetical protein
LDYGPALSEYADSRFSALRGGYGVDSGEGAESWHGVAPGPTAAGSIRLLKLHGSLNWAQATEPLPLRDDIYDRLETGVVQPPLTGKSVKGEPFNKVWRQARRRVKSARRLILVGYSMPVADGLVRSLLSTDLQSVLEDVFVVEPDPATRDRHIEFFTRRAQDARVYVFSTFAEFAQMLNS